MERGRWDALFADLEAELDGEEARELDAEVRDRAAVEHARLTLADRLVAHVGAHVAVTTAGAGVLRGRLTGAARDWLTVGDTLVPRLAVLGVSGLGEAATEPEERPRAPRTIASVLRGMAYEGPVTCVFTDGRTLTAPIERVGKDHVDLGGTAVPFRAVAAIRPA
ncbi:MAG TPA: hypothetical protein VNQ77_20600 [Frankiaceae bacterium]|nr:hypothetical protein [Frankiaceae bacterium]